MAQGPSEAEREEGRCVWWGGGGGGGMQGEKRGGKRGRNVCVCVVDNGDTILECNKPHKTMVYNNN